MRVIVGAARRGRDADQVEHLDGALPGSFAVDVHVIPDGFRDLFADLVDRVQGGHWLLEDHGYVLAADVSHRLRAKVQQVAVLELDASAHHFTGVVDQTHDAERGHALAAA